MVWRGLIGGHHDPDMAIIPAHARPLVTPDKTNRAGPIYTARLRQFVVGHRTRVRGNDPRSVHEDVLRAARRRCNGSEPAETGAACHRADRPGSVKAINLNQPPRHFRPPSEPRRASCYFARRFARRRCGGNWSPASDRTRPLQRIRVFVSSGKRRLSSTAADSSPARSKASRIAEASASVTRNIQVAWHGRSCRQAGGGLSDRNE